MTKHTTADISARQHADGCHVLFQVLHLRLAAPWACPRRLACEPPRIHVKQTKIGSLFQELLTNSFSRKVFFYHGSISFLRVLVQHWVFHVASTPKPVMCFGVRKTAVALVVCRAPKSAFVRPTVSCAQARGYVHMWMWHVNVTWKRLWIIGGTISFHGCHYAMCHVLRAVQGRS